MYLQDLTLFYLSTDNFLSLLTSRLDSLVSAAACELLDTLKDDVANEVKKAFSLAHAEHKLEEAMGRKAHELIEQVGRT